MNNKYADSARQAGIRSMAIESRTRILLNIRTGMNKPSIHLIG
jgi:hypothetical protein